MPFTAKSLADGQMAIAWASLYTPSGVTAVVKSATFHNTSATTQTVELAITRSGGTRRILARATLLQNESWQYLTDGELISLSASDAFEGQTTTASVVDFTITGADQ